MHIERLHRSAVFALLFLLAFSILWKGGKTLETTWILVAVAWALVVTEWWMRRHASHPEARVDSAHAIWITSIGFAVWSGLSFLNSSTQNYGLDEVLRDGSLAILFLSVVRMTRREARWPEHVLTILALTTLVAAVIGAFVYVLQPVNRFVGTFFDHRFHTDYWPNAWAEFLLLAWPAVLWWTVQVADVRSRRLRFVLFGFLLGTLLLSFSRGALLACALQLAMGAVWFVHSRPAPRTQGWVLLSAKICGIALIALLTFVIVNVARSHFFDVESVARKVTFTAAEGTSSVSERSTFWWQAIVLSKDHPLLGYGPYSFRFLQPRMQQGVYETSDHPHNVFLKLAMERGWPTALLFLALVLIVLLRGVRLILYGSSTDVLLPMVILLAIAGVLVHSLLDYNLQFVGIALPFWLLLGFLEGFQPPVCVSSRLLLVRRAIEAVAISLLLVLAINEGRFLVFSSFGRQAEAAGEIDHALAWYDASKSELFSRDLHLSRAGLLMEEQRLDEAGSALDDYFRQNGEDARAWKMRGDLLRMQGDLGAAKTAYKGAYVRGRYNYLSILEGLLQLWRDLDDTEALQRWREDIMIVLQRYAEGIVQNTHFIALSDNVETYLRVAKLTGELFPEHEAALDILSARVDRHAKEEREKYSSRRPGMLW